MTEAVRSFVLFAVNVRSCLQKRERKVESCMLLVK